MRHANVTLSGEIQESFRWATTTAPTDTTALVNVMLTAPQIDDNKHKANGWEPQQINLLIRSLTVVLFPQPKWYQWSLANLQWTTSCSLQVYHRLPAPFGRWKKYHCEPPGRSRWYFFHRPNGVKPLTMVFFLSPNWCRTRLPMKKVPPWAALFY